jgi:hypothetical protein
LLQFFDGFCGFNLTAESASAVSETAEADHFKQIQYIELLGEFEEICGTALAS